MIRRASDASAAPTPAAAARIVTAIAGGTVERIARFPNGLAHYVYDVALVDGRRYVVRLTTLESRREFEGAVYWSHRLRPLGVPLPELLYADVDGDAYAFPVLIMQRLPGSDLGDVYSELSSSQKDRLALDIVALHRRVVTLPDGPGFGYANTYDDASLKTTWKDVLDASLSRSRARIADASIVDPAVAEPVQAAVDAASSYLASVEPTCFLHDTTTKNVLVAEGRLSGIVDVDSVCFGDPLFTPALAQMALLSLGYDTLYIDAWVDALQLTDDQRSALTRYTAVHCVAFLSEIGQRFNRDQPITADPEHVARLHAILTQLLTELHNRQ